MHMKIAFMTMALPMIAIALSELVKIPLTKGLVRIKSYLGKCLSILGLVLVCWLTFDQVIVSSGKYYKYGTKTC